MELDDKIPVIYDDYKPGQRFVCLGGTVRRMENFARLVGQELGLIDAESAQLTDLTGASDRYSMFKVGPVLAVSHGIGLGSLSVLLHELIKLVHYAGCRNVQFFRIGTSGGIDVPPGTLVITERAVNELLQPFASLNIMGRVVQRPAEFDRKIIDDLMETAKQLPEIAPHTMVGATISAEDFYETQLRLDGAFCSYTNEDKQRRLREFSKAGIVNIEMEALMFGSMCRRAGIASAVVCVTLVDRIRDDQVDHQKSLVHQLRPQMLVMEYIKRQMQK